MKPALVLMVAATAWASVAEGKPLLRVRGREIAVSVRIRKGFVTAKFGFRVKGSARDLWKVIGSFKRWHRLVDGMEPVRVRVKGKGRRRVYDLVIKGSLLWDYGFRVQARKRYLKGRGSIRWTVLGTKPASTGEMRVDPAGKKGAIFSFATRVEKGISLPDFLVATVLRVAIRAAGKAVRAAIEAGK